MVHCCVPGCKNTHHHKNKKDEWGSNNDARNYSLHDLPNEERMDIRELWIMAINRTTLPKDVAVCSDHFTEDCFDEKWEEYKRKYGPTKVKRKLKLDAVPTIFPGRIFIHEKVQRIKENWKNKVLQKQIEMERLRLEREYKDRFKFTQTECTCKCKCKQRRKNFSQQVNFSFKFMEDVGTQFPKDISQTVKDEHSYGKYKLRKGGAGATATSPSKTPATPTLSVTSPSPTADENEDDASSPVIKKDDGVNVVGVDTATDMLPMDESYQDESCQTSLKRLNEDENLETNPSKKQRGEEEEDLVDESNDELDLETESDHEEVPVKE